MHLISKLRLRVVLFLIAVVPMTIGVVSMVGLARNAQQDEAQANVTSADLDVFIGMRDLQASVDAEMYLYIGWAEYVISSGEASVPTALIHELIAKSLADTSINAYESALAAANTDAQREVVLETGKQIATARDDFITGDFPALFATGERLRSEYEGLDTQAQSILARHDYSWVALQEQAVYNARLSREIHALASLSLAPSTEAERQQVAVFSAETDLAFGRFLGTISEQDQTRMEASLASTELMPMRQLLGHSTVAQYGSLPAVMAALGSFDQYIQTTDEIRRASAAELGAKAEVAAAQAEREYNLFLAGAIATIALPGLLVLSISRNLSQRLEAVAEAAHDLSNGELGVRIDDVKGNDEIATVALAFNDLSATMATSHDQISALADGRFDDEVLEHPLPGEIGKTLRLALRRLSNASAELAHLASHDRLTGLLDRRGLHQYMISLPAAAGSIALIDLDRFKSINDTYGHEAGDAVIVAVSKRLQSICRSGDAVARIGGDEFVIATGIDGLDRLATLVEDALTAICEPIHWDDKTLSISASIGYTHFDSSETYETSLSRADLAMYRAKRDDNARTVMAEAPTSG